MKKLFVFIVMALSLSASAQKIEVVTSHMTFDNWYFGINVGAATSMQQWGNAGFMKGFAPSVGLRLGKHLTTSFGLALDANAYVMADDKSLMKTSSFVDAVNIGAIGTFNLSNLFGGFKGEPRRVELFALGGFGWTQQSGGVGVSSANGVTSKLAFDLAFNLGTTRALQFYVEPAAVFCLYDNGHLTNALCRHVSSGGKFDSRSGLFQLNFGLNYKFLNSNGTHNFAYARLRDQSEIDALNARINELRNELDRKDIRIARDIRRIAELEDSLETAKKTKPIIIPYTDTSK